MFGNLTDVPNTDVRMALVIDKDEKNNYINSNNRRIAYWGKKWLVGMVLIEYLW